MIFPEDVDTSEKRLAYCAELPLNLKSEAYKEYRRLYLLEKQAETEAKYGVPDPDKIFIMGEWVTRE